jgi:hypothetical protein
MTLITTPIDVARRALRDAGRIVAVAEKNELARLQALREAAKSLQAHVWEGWIASPLNPSSRVAITIIITVPKLTAAGIVGATTPRSMSVTS